MKWIKILRIKCKNIQDYMNKNNNDKNIYTNIYIYKYRIKCIKIYSKMFKNIYIR